jgi:hypothetical protein
MPVILATQEADIRRQFRSQPGQIVRKTLSQKYLSQKWAGGVAQGVGPEFKHQYCKNKTKQKQTTALNLTSVAHQWWHCSRG